MRWDGCACEDNMRSATRCERTHRRGKRVGRCALGGRHNAPQASFLLKELISRIRTEPSKIEASSALSSPPLHAMASSPRQCGFPSCSSAGAEVTKKCTACGAMWYCSRDHQRGHWKAHKVECRGGKATGASVGDGAAGGAGAAAPALVGLPVAPLVFTRAVPHRAARRALLCGGSRAGREPALPRGHRGQREVSSNQFAKVKLRVLATSFHLESACTR